MSSENHRDDASAEGSESEEGVRRLARVAATGRRLNSDPRLLTALRRLRKALPGDSRFGDPLSVSGGKQSDLVGRRIAELTAERPGLLREAGLSALQVWQSLAESQGRGRGDIELTIVFTDLVEFSSWAMEAGDEAALALLRDVGEAIEPPVTDRGGDVVKRLGDGMMAVFRDPADAVEAVLAGRANLATIEGPGYKPRIRAGIHIGSPRRIGDDYLGVDVNVAARVAEGAGADQLLASDRVIASLPEDSFEARRKRLFRAKGVPKEIEVYELRAKE